MSKRNNVAVLLILIILAALGLLAWASSKEAAVVGPTAMRLGPDGSIYLACENKLYVHDDQGGLQDVISLQKFGIKQLVGDFWVFQNRDILLRRHSEQTHSFWREIEMFLRLGSGEGDSIASPEGILQRCGMTSFACTAFGAGSDAFKKRGTFKLFVDEKAGRVFVADTLGHELLLYDQNGIQLSRSGPSFKFPNQLLLHADGLLYVADTNHHRIAAVSADPETFGKLHRAYQLAGALQVIGQVWPFALEQLADTGWLVINGGDNMSHGAVVVYDRNFTAGRPVALPRDADPLAIVAIGDRILITDPTLMRVYSLDQGGALLDDFGSQTLKLHFSELLRKKTHYQAINRIARVLVLISAVAALVIAVVMRKAQARQPAVTTQGVSGTAALTGRGNLKYDYHSLSSQFKILNIIMAVLLGALLLFLSGTPVKNHPAYVLLLLISPLAVMMMYYVYFQIRSASIELSEQGIVFVMGKKRVSSPWRGVQEIKAIGGMQHRIYTEAGKIPIGRVEPADGLARKWSSVVSSQGDHYSRELIEEVKKRAPHVKVTRAWFG